MWRGTRGGAVALTLGAALSLGFAGSVAAHGDETAVGRPVEFSVRIVPAAEIEPETWAIEDGIASYRDGSWEGQIVDVTDPRLDGEVTLRSNRDLHLGAFGLSLSNTVIRIETPDGSWEEIPSMAVDFGDGRATTRTSALVGADAYAGWLAVAEITFDPDTGSLDLEGVILEAEVPPAP